jgi:hypothetical protein
MTRYWKKSNSHSIRDLRLTSHSRTYKDTLSIHSNLRNKSKRKRTPLTRLTRV